MRGFLRIVLPLGALALGLLTVGWIVTPAVDDLSEQVHAVAGASYTPMGAISRRMQVAMVAIEDERFFRHHGFDTPGVLRALLDNLRSGHLDQGASTITQQLAKRVYLHSDDRTLRRKVKEVILALKIERQYSKPQILEWYLNDVYFGANATGIGAATERYFGVTPAQLTLAQAALLAGLPQAPSVLNPYVNFTGAKARQRAVLAQMARDGYISPEQAETAASEPLGLRHS